MEGTVPETLASCRQLAYCDLSQNKLGGEIPEALLQRQGLRLGVLNQYYNYEEGFNGMGPADENISTLSSIVDHEALHVTTSSPFLPAGCLISIVSADGASDSVGLGLEEYSSCSEQGFASPQ